MANHESTAVNALIEQVAIGGPPGRDEELMFAPPAKRLVAKSNGPRLSGTVPPERGAGEVAPLPRKPNGTDRQLPHVGDVRMSVAPPRANSIPPIPMPSQSVPFKIPVAPPSASEAISMNAADSARSRLPLQSPPSHPPGYMLPTTSVASGSAPTYLPPGTSDSWFTSSQSSTTEHQRDSFGSTEGTVQVMRPRASTAALVGKLVGPMLVLVVAGIFLGGYIAFDGQGNKDKAAAAAPAKAPGLVAAAAATDELPPAPAAPAPAAPSPAPAPVEPIAQPPAAVAASPSPFVEVRIDSKPSGATVMLVDRGKTTFLGTTPLDAALDPAHEVELVFTHGDRPTRVEPLDPSAQKRVAVVLAPVSRTPATPAVVDTAVAPPRVEEPPTAAERKRAERKAARAVARAARAAKVDDVKVAADANAAPVGEGVLMISSKPPCEIYIDGKPTGLVTPQRSIPLAAGSHKITLVNDAEKIKKTIAVQITADKPTKVLQDLMK